MGQISYFNQLDNQLIQIADMQTNKPINYNPNSQLGSFPQQNNNLQNSNMTGFGNGHQLNNTQNMTNAQRLGVIVDQKGALHIPGMGKIFTPPMKLPSRQNYPLPNFENKPQDKNINPGMMNMGKPPSTTPNKNQDKIIKINQAPSEQTKALWNLQTHSIAPKNDVNPNFLKPQTQNQGTNFLKNQNQSSGNSMNSLTSPFKPSQPNYNVIGNTQNVLNLPQTQNVLNLPQTQNVLNLPQTQNVLNLPQTQNIKQSVSNQSFSNQVPNQSFSQQANINPISNNALFQNPNNQPLSNQSQQALWNSTSANNVPIQNYQQNQQLNSDQAEQQYLQSSYPQYNYEPSSNGPQTAVSFYSCVNDSVQQLSYLMQYQRYQQEEYQRQDYLKLQQDLFCRKLQSLDNQKFPELCSDDQEKQDRIIVIIQKEVQKTPKKQQILIHKKTRKTQPLNKPDQQNLDLDYCFSEANAFSAAGETKIPEYYYEIDIMWDESPVEEMFETIDGFLHFTVSPTCKQIKQAVFKVVSSKKILKHGAYFEMNPIVGTKSYLRCNVTGTIIQHKINLPKCYGYFPKEFKGFQVQDLRIIGKYCSAFWPGLTNVKDIDFSCGLELGEDFIDCRIKTLSKRCLVVFNTLPPKIEELVSIKWKQEAERVFKKFMSRIQNCRLKSFDFELKTYEVEFDNFEPRQKA